MNSPKVSISVYVLAANSHDGVFVRTTRAKLENSKSELVLGRRQACGSHRRRGSRGSRSSNSCPNENLATNEY